MGVESTQVASPGSRTLRHAPATPPQHDVEPRIKELDASRPPLLARFERLGLDTSSSSAGEEAVSSSGETAEGGDSNDISPGFSLEFSQQEDLPPWTFSPHDEHEPILQPNDDRFCLLPIK
jgi:hypothetical protein